MPTIEKSGIRTHKLKINWHGTYSNHPNFNQ